STLTRIRCKACLLRILHGRCCRGGDACPTDPCDALDQTADLTPKGKDEDDGDSADPWRPRGQDCREHVEDLIHHCARIIAVRRPHARPLVRRRESPRVGGGLGRESSAARTLWPEAYRR